MLQPDLGLLYPILLYTSPSGCYTLAQPGPASGLTHMYDTGYCTLAWSGLLLGLVLVLTFRDCALTKEVPKLLYHASSKWKKGGSLPQCDLVHLLSWQAQRPCLICLHPLWFLLLGVAAQPHLVHAKT